MSRIIIIIMWSKSQVPLYMKTIKCDDINCYFSFSTNIYYKDIESIFLFYTYCLPLQRNTHRFYYHIQSRMERAICFMAKSISPIGKHAYYIQYQLHQLQRGQRIHLDSLEECIYKGKQELSGSIQRSYNTSRFSPVEYFIRLQKYISKSLGQCFRTTNGV